jgi:hypothetical protein
MGRVQLCHKNDLTLVQVCQTGLPKLAGELI